MSKPRSNRRIEPLVLASLFILPSSVALGSESPPESIELTGVVRDFRERTVEGGHIDFERRPDRGYGLYCGNVSVLLGDDGLPVFTGAGRMITKPYRDAAGRPIAPHLLNATFGEGAAPAPSSCAQSVDQDGDPAVEICLVSASFNEDGTSRWTYHVEEIDGGRNLKYFELGLDAAHNLADGSTAGATRTANGVRWNITKDFETSDFSVVLEGHLTGAESPHGFYAKCGRHIASGALTVPTLIESEIGPFGGGIALHVDESMGDSMGEESYSDSGGIECAGSFASWYRDTLGVNLSKQLTLEFVRQEDGTYVFDDKLDEQYASLGGFFPIENDLFGNPGGSPDRNFHFTFELHTEFTYDAEAEQVFKFIGDDDVWVFVDGKLAIDLGGVHSAQEQYIDMDRMGLEDGETYDLDFFFAERHRTQSNFRVETNMQLVTARLPSITNAFD